MANHPPAVGSMSYSHRRESSQPLPEDSATTSSIEKVSEFSVPRLSLEGVTLLQTIAPGKNFIKNGEQKFSPSSLAVY